MLVRDLSGGNRRKLSVAVTCFGRTSLVLLDEPTSDMDPVTRHLTYDCIAGLLADDRAVILTSHTIAEIDRVCDRIAILRRGRLVSMGDTRALQSMYGLCYAVTVWRHADHQADGTALGTDASVAALRQLEQQLRECVPGMESATVAPGVQGGVQFIVRIRAAVEADAGAQRQALRLSELCERLHAFAAQHAGVAYTLAECLLDQVRTTDGIDLIDLNRWTNNRLQIAGIRTCAGDESEQLYVCESGVHAERDCDSDDGVVRRGGRNVVYWFDKKYILYVNRHRCKLRCCDWIISVDDL